MKAKYLLIFDSFANPKDTNAKDMFHLLLTLFNVETFRNKMSHTYLLLN